MKPCAKCGKEKPLTDYAVEPTGKDGRRATCKTCMNKNSRISGWRGPSSRLPGYVSRSIGL